MDTLEQQYRKFFSKYGFHQGRMITTSKSRYLTNYPINLVVFNACVATLTVGIVWNGDLDLTLDTLKLGDLADELHENLYILHEKDGCVEQISAEEITSRAYATIYHNEE